MRYCGLIFIVSLPLACVGPQVSDELAPSGGILPAGSEVPDGHADPALDARIAENDGVEGEVARISAFASGARVWYWDLGPAKTTLAPIFVLVDDGEAIDHNVIVTTVPGDVAYSPFWRVNTVEVTDDYAGERITSAAALEEAERAGLVEAPVAQDAAINCPMVGAEVTLAVGGGESPMSPSTRFYWEGVALRYFDLGAMAFGGPAAVEGRLLRLAREGQAPLSETIRGVDMTGDGDLGDSNDILSSNAAEEGYTPACRFVGVQVPVSYASIDTSGDETVADFRSESDLFDPDPVVGNVVAFTDAGAVRNCAVQRMSGGL